MTLDVAPLLPASSLPLRITPERPAQLLDALDPGTLRCSAQLLSSAGALLFRGFRVGGVAAFRRFAQSFGSELLGYEFGSTPRNEVGDGIYSSTEYPAHQSIPLHNEQSYSLRWPMKIWFYCVQPAERGGETPIADSREVYRRMPQRIVQRFSERRLQYVRNYGQGLDVPWQRVFNTQDRRQVEAFCRAHAIACEWKDDGELRTRQVCQATAQHPQTREWVWFNQAHLFHPSGLAPDVREALLELAEPEDLPRNVYYGDGSPLEESLLDEVRAVLESSKIAFPWAAGDVLMLDNMLVAHARSPFEGPRRVVVAMADAHSG